MEQIQRIKILIGYDGTKGADLALEDLRRAGLPHEADVLVVTVAEPSFLLLGPGSLEMILRRDSIIGTGASPNAGGEGRRFRFAVRNADRKGR